jgi:methyl-accepting chemotaxis protein
MNLGGKLMKLRTKTSIPIIVILMVSISLLGIITYFKSKDIILSQLYTQADSELKTSKMIMEKFPSDINDFVAAMKIGKEGYGYVVNGEGIITVHPDSKTVGLDLKGYDWGKKILEKQKGDLNYIFNNAERYTTFDKVGDNIMVIAIPTHEFIGPLNSLKATIIVVLVVSVLLSMLIIGYLLKRQVILPINKLVGKMEQAGSGDLNVNISFKTQDEIGQLGNAFNKMVENIRNLVMNTNEVVVRLQSTSELISSSMAEVSMSSEEVSKTSQEIAGGATNQAEESTETLHVTLELASIIEDVTEKLKIADKHTREMSEKNQIGNQAILDLDKSFKVNTNVIFEVSKDVEELATKSNSIENILQAIKTISDQTNLLALNAAIEAARAGEQGRGFAVVAEEIRKLAEQTALSVEEIQRIVTEIINIITRASRTAENVKETEKKANISFIDTKEAFEKIGFSVEEVVKSIDKLNKDISAMESLKTNVVNSMENISAVAEQTAAATEEISACAQEQNASTEEITASIHELDNMIDTLVESISEFKIN